MLRLTKWAAEASLLMAVPAIAQQGGMQGMDHSKMGGMAASMTEGEVRKIDKEAKKITLKHGDIKNLDMPGMTMVFQVKDKAMLDKVQAGDKVKFKAANESGKFTVTELEAVK